MIDLAKRIIYVISKRGDDNGPTELHALDLTTGEEKPGSPVTFAATVPGTGDASRSGHLSFDTTHENCRPALLLVKGIVYAAFAHNSDSFPYHGWIFGYRYTGSGFRRTAVFCTAPNGGLSGIWQSGKGLTADKQGYIYCSVGNGAFDADRGGSSYGMCYLKLSTPGLKAVDWFAPYDEKMQSDRDADLGGGGLVDIASAHRLFAGGTKFGTAFLLNTDNMGRFTPGGPDNVTARIEGISPNNSVGQNPVAWNRRDHLSLPMAESRAARAVPARRLNR